MVLCAVLYTVLYTVRYVYSRVYMGTLEQLVLEWAPPPCSFPLLLGIDFRYITQKGVGTEALSTYRYFLSRFL